MQKDLKLCIIWVGLRLWWHFFQRFSATLHILPDVVLSARCEREWRVTAETKTEEKPRRKLWQGHAQNFRFIITGSQNVGEIEATNFFGVENFFFGDFLISSLLARAQQVHNKLFRESRQDVDTQATCSIISQLTKFLKSFLGSFNRRRSQLKLLPSINEDRKIKSQTFHSYLNVRFESDINIHGAACDLLLLLVVYSLVVKSSQEH